MLLLETTLVLDDLEVEVEEIFSILLELLVLQILVQDDHDLEVEVMLQELVDLE